MKFTLSWLKEHLKTNASLKEIVNTLNKIGLEVSNTKIYNSHIDKLEVVKIIKIYLNIYVFFSINNSPEVSYSLIKTF